MRRNNSNYGAEAPSKNETIAEHYRAIRERGGECAWPDCHVDDPEDLRITESGDPICEAHEATRRRIVREHQAEREQAIEDYYEEMEYLKRGHKAELQRHEATAARGDN